MKVIIMAAGRGTRISRHIGGNPKCTVDIGGTSLIENTVDQLKKKGINDIALVLGYKSEVIKNLLKDKGVKFFYNPFYDVTNSIASLWFAKEFIGEDDDLILLNGDVFCEEKLLDEILAEELSPVLFADETRKEEGDYKFYYENNILLKYGKELTGKDITGEYVGIAKIKKEFIPQFIKQLNELIQNQQHGLWWENILYTLTDKKDIYVKDVKKMFWAEVDYIEDYQRILNYRGVSDILVK